MKLIEIDAIQPQALQAAFDCPPQMVLPPAQSAVGGGGGLHVTVCVKLMPDTGGEPEAKICWLPGKNEIR